MIFEQMFGQRGFPSGSGGESRGSFGSQRGGGGGGDGGSFFLGTDVEMITSANAKSVIGKDVRKQDGRVWTIMFFAPWCGHCKSTKPEFSNFAKNAKGVVRVGAVNCDEDKKLCSHYRVQGFPTIISLLPDSSDPVTYNGQRSASGFYDHSQSLIPKKFIVSASSEEQGQAQCDKNPAKACVVLLSEKSAPTPLAKALAFRLQNVAVTVQVKVSKPRKNIVFGDSKTKIPAVFVNGKVYTGPARMDNMYKFIMGEVKSSSKKGSKTSRDDL